jgi:uncharacterized membrane protein
MGVPEQAVDRHESLAIATLVVFGLLLLFRWRVKSWTTHQRVIYLSVAMFGLLLLGATGFYGGELVYRFGAGVTQIKP